MSARTRIVLGLTVSSLGLWTPRPGHAAGLSGEPAGVQVSLRARVDHGSAGGALLGMLTLDVPLERFARKNAKAEAPALQEEPRVVDEGSVEADAATQSPAKGAEAERPVFVLTHELVRATLARAWGLAGHRSASQRLDGIASRARAAAALPELRLRAARVTDESLRLSPTLDDPYRYTRAGGTNLLFEARATWKLDRLLFADEELAVERLRGEQARARGALTERVLKALFAWQRAELKGRDPQADPEARTQSLLLALEAELTLDVLTGGWFSEALRGAGAAAQAETATSLQPGGDPRAGGQRAGQDRQQAVDNARHACRDTHHAPGPQAARRCAKGVSLTSRHSDAK